MTNEERQAARTRKLRRLKNVQVDEVSLVDNPANCRKFLLFKSTGAHAARMVDITSQYDEREINKAFEELSPERQQVFLESLKALNKRLVDMGGADDGEAAQMEYEFGSLPAEEKEQVLTRIRKAMAAIAKLEDSEISQIAKANLVDIWRTQLGMIRLGLRDPGLLDEFNKSTAAERDANWMYQLDENEIPIIQRRLKRPFGPGESATHIFKEGPQGWAWYPKRGRNADGTFKS